ncbi:DesA family fatty acid desaturase [Halopseudomonas salegens]|uniref:Fatty-acid desaturase n=1 Tax=Halopseudomonas salegens TaxID=1434072 RepID=A0A1H2HUN0_9GAMM|nr:acyl-CoA desaturase [Halopseudomonas salegens]SDU35590.1 Fatty-acid desaturase [Halopseudomonas salegens]
MWYDGILQFSWWQVVLATLVMTHITIVSVTVYLHRYSAHRSLELHPALQHFFRFWLWLTTGMVTREWTAIHRKHHAKCETPDDPHSPVQKGLWKVLSQGAELYQAEAANQETLDTYGKHCPDDWLERNIYSRAPYAGVTLLALIDLALFGAIGITVWAVQMLWIPLLAAGVINGIGHALGYRNFECKDAATNILPWGILIGGEELHNNHHTYPSSAKLSVRPWEFDIGWMWIRLFSMLRLANVRRVAPVPVREPNKTVLDMDSARALLSNRFQVMAQYRRMVIAPLVKAERERVDASMQRLLKRTKKLLWRDTDLLKPQHRERLDRILASNQRLQLIYQKRLELQQIWSRTSSSGQERLHALREWCQQAEASGIKALQDFADSLRTYTLQPNRG